MNDSRKGGFLFQKSKPPKSNHDGRIRRIGAGQETNGVAQSALSKEGECPFLVEEKQAFAPPSFRTTPKGLVAVVQMSPDWEGQRLLGHVPIG